MWELLGKLLPVGNALTGFAALMALLAWVTANEDLTVCFTAAQMAVVGGIIFALLEINRRSRPPG